MSLTCGFYDSQDNDRLYYNSDLSNFLEGLITDGIYEFIGQKMIVEANTPGNLSVNVGTGRAWFNGTWTKIDSPEAVYFQNDYAPDPIESRIDALCLTINKDRATRDNYIEIIKGTGAVSNPQKPTVTDEANLFRHVIAYVTIPAGCTAITQAQIENRVGMGSALFSAPKWGNVPTTEEMVAQWQAQFDEFMDYIHQTFDYDAAGNLQLGIENLAPDISEVTSDDKYALDQNVLKKKDSNNTWSPTKVSVEIMDMKSTFQAGVDAVYDAVTAIGLTPASSTPEAIAEAIRTILNADATAGEILTGKKAYSQLQMLTGSMPNKGAWTGTGTPTGNNQVNVAIPAGYHNGSGYVTCKGQTAYSAGYNAGLTQGHADMNVSSFPISVYAPGVKNVTLILNLANHKEYQIPIGGNSTGSNTAWISHSYNAFVFS